MTIEEAFKNLDNLIAISRLTRQEHIVFEQSLKTLFDEANKKQKDGDE